MQTAIIVIVKVPFNQGFNSKVYVNLIVYKYKKTGILKWERNAGTI